MANLGEAFVQIIADTSRFASSAADGVKKGLDEVGKGFNSQLDSIAADAEKKFKELGGTLQATGKTLSKRVTAPIVGVATAAILTGQKFDDQMARVRAISGATGDDFNKLRENATRLGSETRFSATEAAGGMEFLALAGFETNEIIAAMPGLLDLASAGNMDLARASDIVSDTMSAFRMDASRAGEAADIFAQQSAMSNTNVEQLGAAMARAAPAAAAAGMSLGDTSAILGVFADNAIKGGAGGTTLNAIIRDMLNVVEDGIVDFGDFSVALFDAEGNFRDMGDVIGEIEAGTQGLSDAQREAALRGVFQSQSIRGVNVLMGDGVNQMNKYREANANASGAAGDMAAIMEDTLGGAFRELRSRMEGVLIQLSDILVPIIRENVIPLFFNMFERINGLIERFRNLSERTQTFIVAAVALVAALGPILIAVGTMMKLFAFAIKPIVSVIKVFALLSKGILILVKTVVPLLLKAFIGIGKGLFVLGKIILANPLFLIPILIIGLVALFWHFREQITEAMQKAWEWVTERTQQFIDWITSGISKLVDFFVDAFDRLRARVVELWQKVRDFLVNTFDNVRDKIVSGVEFVRDKFIDGIKALVNGVKAPLNMLIGFANAVIGGFERMINVVGDGLRGLPSFTVPSWVPAIGGSQFKIPSFGPISLPRIPQLATGGIVRSDTLARIGEAGREAVVPLDRDRDPLNIAGILAEMQPSRNVTVNVYGEVGSMDEERLATLLRRSELLEGVR